MKWFKKSSPKKDANQSKSLDMFEWIKRSKDVRDDEETLSPLQREIDVVPRTELSASRQTVENINIALSAGESSLGEASGKKLEGLNESGDCGVIDCDNADAAKQSKTSKVNLTDTLRAADNNAHASLRSLPDATVHRPSPLPQTDDYIEYYDAYVDYGRLEVPDSVYASVNGLSGAPFAPFVELKSRGERNVSETSDLFNNTDRIKIPTDKTPLDYQLLSNVEKNIDESRFNLFNCRAYNEECRAIDRVLGTNRMSEWPLEDFNDDGKSTRMSNDTRTVKEFYRLGIDGHILVHFHDISVQVGRTEATMSEKFLDFCFRLFFRAKEITEEQRVPRNWMKELSKIFRKRSKCKGIEKIKKARRPRKPTSRLCFTINVFVEDRNLMNLNFLRS